MKRIKRRIVELDLDLVEPNPNQPRTDSNTDGINDLADNIEREGIQNLPLVEVHPDKPGNYRLISGERRWRALCHLYSKGRGEKTAEFMLIEGNESSYLASVVENTNRRDLNPIEEARTILRLRSSEFGMTWGEIADLMSESEMTLQNRVKLLDLPWEIRNMVASNQLPSVHALNLRRHDNMSEALRIAHDLIAGREVPDFHFREMNAHGAKTVERRLPQTPEEYASRIVRTVGRVQSFPIVLTSFLELPPDKRKVAVESIDPAVRSRVRNVVARLANLAGKLAVELDVGIPPSPQKVKLQSTDDKIPTVSPILAHQVLSNMISGKGTSLHVDLSKSSLGKKLGVNGDNPEPLALGSFRVMRESWGRDVPRGNSPERDFMNFVYDLKRKLGSPKFVRALTLIRDRDKSTDPINLSLV